jgi:hypothetical protein
MRQLIMTKFMACLKQTKLQRVTRKALALAPRGGVRDDVLTINQLSNIPAQQLRIDWCARDVHPWDRDRPPRDQAELFCQQALHDTEAALLRLFQMLPDIHQVDFRVLDPQASHQVILAGNVEREEIPGARRLQSIKMRLMMMGVRFLMAGGHLEPLTA